MLTWIRSWRARRRQQKNLDAGWQPSKDNWTKFDKPWEKN